VKPLIPYLRQSRQKEISISIEEQRRSIRMWAIEQGVPLAAEVIERDVSGSKDWRQRGIGRAIEAVERGEVQGLIVAFQDRLSRENGLATAEVWAALEKADARLVCAAEGLDTATGDHELLFTIRAAIARDEWKRHRKNWESARRNAIERGVHIGPVPAGYRATVARGKNGKELYDKNGKPVRGPLEPNEHAPAVRQAFEARAAGQSWTQVKRLLEDAGVPTCYGRSEWSVGGVSQLLASEVYLGVVRSGEYRNEEAHEPLVSRAVFKAVQDKRETRAVTRSAKDGLPAEPRLLAGLLHCAACTRHLSVDWMKRPSGKQYAFYRCRNPRCTARPTIGAVKIEQEIEQVLRERLAAEEFQIKTDADDEAAPLRAELAAVQADLDAWLADDSGVSPAAYKARLAVLEARVTKAQEALDAAEVAALAEPLPSINKYDALPISLRREVMAGFLNAIAESGLGRLAVKRGNEDKRFIWIPQAEE